MLQILQIPVLSDNYVYLIHGNGETVVVDPSVAEPVLEVLKINGWKLDYIINTHHHWDHTDGNKELKKKTKAKIIAYQGDSHRIKADEYVDDGNVIQVCGEMAQVMFIPGHTLGHVAYYFPVSKLLFCGDTLFSMGCGRLFEGTAEQMFNSLQKIAKLPGDTKVYCAHEYTQNNGEFALTIEPDNKNLQRRMKQVNKLRSEDKPTIPSTIALEMDTNPFLHTKTFKEFAKIRKKKDSF